MASLTEIIDRAEQIAVGRGIDPHQSPVIDGTMTFEALIPHALRYEIKRRLRTGEDQQDLIKSHTIAIVAGVGALPSSVLKEAWRTWTLTDRPRCAVIPYDRYNGYKFGGAAAIAQLDYLSVLGNSVLFKESATASYTGNITLNAPTIPRLNSQSLLPAAIDSGSDTITFQDQHTWETGDEAYLSSTVTAPSAAGLGSPIAPTTPVYIYRVSATIISLATSRANAHAGTIDNITGTGAGVHTLTDSLNASDSIVENIILLLASVMTGEMKVADLLAG